MLSGHRRAGGSTSGHVTDGLETQEVMDARAEATEPDRRPTNRTDGGRTDTEALTTQSNSAVVPPGLLPPCCGGSGAGMGRGMGLPWSSGVSGPRLDAGWIMITGVPVGLQHEQRGPEV